MTAHLNPLEITSPPPPPRKLVSYSDPTNIHFAIMLITRDCTKLHACMGYGLDMGVCLNINMEYIKGGCCKVRWVLIRINDQTLYIDWKAFPFCIHLGVKIPVIY